MKTLFFLLLKINYYYYKHCQFFLQKMLGILVSFYFLIEYIFLFLLKNNYIYNIFLYLYIIRERLIIFKKKKIYKKTIFIKKKKEKEKKEFFFFQLYYKRKMYLGLSIVYIQIFLRKIKEGKNYIKFFFYYKLKSIYFSWKKKNIKNSLYFFFSNNYYLSIYIYNLIKKLYTLVFILAFIEIYKIVEIKEKIFFSINIQLQLLIKKWKN